MKKINTKNSKKLTKALDSAQTKARVRTASAADIETLVARVERTLTGLLYKKDWLCLRFILDPNGQSFPNSYKGIPESTQVIIERGRTAWFVTDVYRGYAQTHEITELNISRYGEQLLAHAESAGVWNA